jgi:teichuronic acid biosynthesis glycosyltransferase TuaG
MVETCGSASGRTMLENQGVPRVSVIIPAHNAEPFLDQTLASVQAQTYEDWEVVVCDDGSRDGTWKVLQAAGPRVRAVRNEQAGGPAVARNRALESASGEFAVFLDADDLLLPQYLEHQLAAYERAGAETRRGEREVGLVACDARFLIDGQYAPYTFLDCIPDRGLPLVLERLLRRNMIYGACLVPRFVGEAVGWFDPELFGTEDYGLWIKILERGWRGILNDESLAVYRRTAGTVSSNLAKQGVNNRRAYELALGRGNLNRRQTRIVRGAIRYNRAMEEVAIARFSTGGARSLAARLPRILPLLTWVALTNVRMWPEWLSLLRTGRAPDVARLHART